MRACSHHMVEKMKIGRIIRIVVSVVLLVSGLVLLAIPSLREYSIQSQVQDIEEHLIDKTRVEYDTSTPQESDPNPSAEDAWSPEALPGLYEEFTTYNQNLIENGQLVSDAWSGEVSSASVARYGLDALGVVEIPDMKVKLPLYVNSTNENLARGAAVMNGTSMPIGGASTNCVIAAHRGWRGNAYFQFIDRMKVGSKVYVHTPWGKLTYQAVAVEIITPSESDKVKIQPDKDMVTLVSCHPYQLGGGPERYLVYCERYQPNNVSDGAEHSRSEWIEAQAGQELGPDDKKDDLLQLEVYVQKYLPPITLVLCGVIVFVRAFRSRKGRS